MFKIAGSADNTKLAAFEVDGLTTSTTRTYTLQDSDDTLVGRATTDTLTNKTLTTPVINVNSDATGDIYYRSSGGLFTRLAIGSNTNIMSVSASGIPEWIANPDTSDATTTTKGITELSTQAQYDARDDSGTTSATNVVTPSICRGILYHDYALDAAGSDTYAITVTPAPAAYTTGDVYTFEAGTVNTGAATLNVNSLGAKSIKNPSGGALIDGEIAAGQIVQCSYDGTSMIMISPSATALVALPGVKGGKAELTTTGDKVISGVGFTPRLIKITCTTQRSSGGGSISSGYANSTSDEGCILHTGTGMSKQNSTIVYGTADNGTTVVVVADMKTIGADGFTLDVTTFTGATKVYITWEAFE